MNQPIFEPWAWKGEHDELRKVAEALQAELAAARKDREILVTVIKTVMNLQSFSDGQLDELKQRCLAAIAQQEGRG